jgi:hypothetical protein
MFDPTSLKATEQRETLPLTVYETVPGHAAALKSPSVVPCEGEKFYLHSVDFTLATSDAELVGVEHAVKTSLSQQQTAAGKLINQQNAVSILMDRVQQVHAYLLDVCENRRTADPIILGEINSLCSKLDFMSNAASDELQAVLNKVFLPCLINDSLKCLCGVGIGRYDCHICSESNDPNDLGIKRRN